MSDDRIDFNALPPKSCVFLVEGSGETGLVRATTRALGIDNASVHNVRGEDHLPTVLKLLVGSIERGSLGSLGIVFDTNESYGSKIASIGASLVTAGFEFDKEKLDAAGIFRGGGPAIGLYLSPGKKNRGRIETMIANEIKGSSISPCLEEYVKCVESKSGLKMNEKGEVQAYLGAQNAAFGVGIAFEKGLLDVRNAAYSQVREMIQELSRLAKGD